MLHSGRFREIQGDSASSDYFFLLLDHFRVVNRCLGGEVWPGHSDPDPSLTQLTDFPDHL